MNVAGWRIYYADGSVVQSQDEGITWDAAPAEGVVAVIVFYEEKFTETEKGISRTVPYRKVYQLEDYYWRFGSDQVIVAGSADDLAFDIDAKNLVVNGIKRGCRPDMQVLQRVRDDIVF